MILGPEKVLSCPHCAAPARLFTLRSGNTIGAVFWTDGKMSAPMLPQAPAVTRCRACSLAYWVSDAPVLGEMELSTSGEYPIEWTTAPEVSHLDETGLLAALAEGLGSDPAREQVLRNLAWQAANDARRPPAFDPTWVTEADLSPAAVENLERLMELADPDSPEGRLVMAEGARELGRFEEALATLARPFPARYQGSAEVLRRLAGAGDSRVRLLDENNPAD